MKVDRTIIFVESLFDILAASSYHVNIRIIQYDYIH